MKVKINATVIGGGGNISHEIEVPNYSEQMREVYIKEWLYKMYPTKIGKLFNIKSEAIQ